MKKTLFALLFATGCSYSEIIPSTNTADEFLKNKEKIIELYQELKEKDVFKIDRYIYNNYSNDKNKYGNCRKYLDLAFKHYNTPLNKRVEILRRLEKAFDFDEMR